MITQLTLTTDRLILRPFRLPDAPSVQRLAGDFAIADTTANIPHPYEDGMAESWIGSHAEHVEQGTAVVFAITLKATGELAGAISLFSIRPAFGRGEMGYWVGVPYWNQGYCTEAAKALIRYAFDDLGMHRVFAEHMVRNPGSGRVMQKAGMTYEGTLRQHVKKWDTYEDLAVYGILRSDRSK
jgi:RimJ/RimL family protein N-acetyltransferase